LDWFFNQHSDWGVLAAAYSSLRTLAGSPPNSPNGYGVFGSSALYNVAAGDQDDHMWLSQASNHRIPVLVSHFSLAQNGSKEYA
jgi:hypothetical protein